MTFGRYKNCNTLNGVIGIMPSGAICFVPHLHCSRISDKELFLRSKPMDLLKPNDIVMADKEYLIEELQENAGPSEAEKRKFKLPKIELKKFNGDPKEFLAFWSQFKKIHDDGSIAEEDKIQYLLQSVEPPSKAERQVLSFPATAANYSKAIEQLKELFGRDNLLVQIYVRDLLVMKTAVKGRSKTDLTYLYDELEGKLRAF
ncbi:DUF1758 domain-containing protein [Trichonephila clavipes]|nr:DUF1758 domain-containing protein [Trichonephila clavipes]